MDDLLDLILGSFMGPVIAVIIGILALGYFVSLPFTMYGDRVNECAASAMHQKQDISDSCWGRDIEIVYNETEYKRTASHNGEVILVDYNKSKIAGAAVKNKTKEFFKGLIGK